MRSIMKSIIGTAAAAFAVAAASAPADAAVVVKKIVIKNGLATPDYIQVAELQAISGGSNVALAVNGGIASATSSYPLAGSNPGMTIDGITGGNYYTDGVWASATPGSFEALTITLGNAYALSALNFYGRTDCCSNRDVFDYILYDANDVVVGSGKVNAISNFATVALPEPATWAMMLMGFGMIGAGVRSRRRPTTKLTYA